MTIQTPERVDIDSLTWRAATAADLPEVHTLFLAAAAGEPHCLLPSLEDLQREFDDRWSPPATDTWLAQWPDGSLAAYGRFIAAGSLAERPTGPWLQHSGIKDFY